MVRKVRGKKRAKLIARCGLIFFILVWISFFCPSLKAAILVYYRYHIVQKGENLWNISKRYGVSVNEIKKKNNLRSDRIYPRQKLIIPIKVKGIYHPVKRYETLWRICKTYGVSMEKVISLNRLQDPNHIMPGQRLFIPGASKVKKIDIPKEIIAAGKKDATSTPPEEDKIQPSPTFGETVKGKGFLIWPLEGKAVSYRRRDFGIDILAPEGTSVVAPAKGKVYYSGLLRNYGWTIIIEHQELGLYTCYMYNSVNLVKKGDLVEKGQPIARIGKSGTAKEAMLHFEVRRAKDGKPMDPLEYLPSDYK